MNDREFLILRNLLSALNECGDYLLPQQQLQAEVALSTPRLSATEFDEALANADAKRLVTAIDGERGRKFKLNDHGRAWLAEHRV